MSGSITPNKKYFLINDSYLDKIVNREIYDPFEVVELVYDSVNIYEGFGKYEKDLSKYNKSQRLLNAVNWLVMEVANGGFLSFYSNSTGVVYQDALAGLKEIGAKDLYAVLSKTIETFKSKPSLDESERFEQLEKLAENPFEKFDDEFFSYTGKDIEKYLFTHVRNYINRNRNDFYFDGYIEEMLFED